MDNAELTTVLIDSQDIIIKLRSAIEEMRPLAEFGQAVMDDGQCYGFDEAAKILNDKLEAETGKRIGRDRLFELCRNIGILQKTDAHWNEPYQIYEHHFKLVTKKTPIGMKVTPLFTGKGLSWILPKIVEYYR